jgi:hypothetical protein
MQDRLATARAEEAEALRRAHHLRAVGSRGDYLAAMRELDASHPAHAVPHHHRRQLPAARLADRPRQAGRPLSRRACAPGSCGACRSPGWRRRRTTPRCWPSARRKTPGWTSCPTARSAARAIRTASPPRWTASTSTTPAPGWTARATPTRCRASSARSAAGMPWRWRTSSSSSATPRADQDHRARPVHDAAAGAERFLQERGRGGDGLRRRGQRRDQGPVRRRRRRGADRRALHAGAAREGAPVRAGRAEPRAGRRAGHDRVHICFGYAAVIHERPSGYSFLPELAGCGCKQVSIETAQSNLDTSVLRNWPASRSWWAASTSPT